MTLLLGLATITGGVALVVSVIAGGRRAAAPAAYLMSVGVGGEPGAATPRPLVDALRRRIAPLLPSHYVDELTHKLETAGRGRALTAEEVATAQVILTAAGLAVAVLLILAASPKPTMAMLLLILLPGMGFLGPKAWVERAARARQAVVRKEMPDMMDLLAISVEAGLGFEAALELGARNFHGALADEVRRALREMELGSSRHDALHAMKRRVDVPELSNFVLALTQADQLGMPISRVLHAQAHELRARRRQWAREKAGKLPVKILFPLVGFIFPSIMVVLMGPAAISVMKALR